jgi:hypothetical protein
MLSVFPNMGFGFDIFRRLDDRSPLWVAQAETLDDARHRLESFAASIPAFISCTTLSLESLSTLTLTIDVSE